MPSGLSEARSRRQLAEHGPNRIEGPRKGLAVSPQGIAAEPMFLMLLAAPIYLVVGDLGEGWPSSRS